MKSGRAKIPAVLRQVLRPPRRMGPATARQLRDVVRADILAQVYRIGDRLPSEADLITQYGASRTAIRGALDLLRDEGVIERVPGAGTSVVTNKATHGLDRLRGLAEGFGSTGSRRVLNEVLAVEVIPAPSPIADRLCLTSGDEVVLIERVRRLDGEPLSLDTSYLPAHLARPLLDQDLASHDVFGLLDGPLGLPLGSARVTIEAVGADEPVSALLGVDVGSPLLLIDRLTRLRDGRPIDLEFLRYRGDRMSLSALLTRDHTEDT